MIILNPSLNPHHGYQYTLLNIDYENAKYNDETWCEGLGPGLDRLNTAIFGGGARPRSAAAAASSPKSVAAISKLQDLVSQVIVKQPRLIDEAIKYLPPLVLPTLLKQALHMLVNERDAIDAIVALVARWPLPVLNLREICPELSNTLFIKNNAGAVSLARGLLMREEHQGECRLKTIDVRGFSLNIFFVIGFQTVIPLMSLYRGMRDSALLTDEISKTLGISPQSTLAQGMRSSIETLLNQSVRCSGYIHVPIGERLQILTDEIMYQAGDNTLWYFKEMVMLTALRHILPLSLVPSNITIQVRDGITSKELPVYCRLLNDLLGCFNENMKGLSFYVTSADLHPYVVRAIKSLNSITSLDLGLCDINMTGRTRSRTGLRTSLGGAFRDLRHLNRLSVSRCKFLGCLSELLSVLVRPLEYLNLQDCELNNDDLAYLCQSHHAVVLSELNLRGVRRSDVGAMVDASAIVCCVSAVAETVVKLTLDSNIFGDRHVDDMRLALTRCKRLKSLQMNHCGFSQTAWLRLIEACSIVPTLQLVSLSHSVELWFEISLDETLQSIEAFRDSCQRILDRNSRTDIKVVISMLDPYDL